MGGIGTEICQRLAKEGLTVVAGCGPSRNFKQWLDEQAALGYSFHASVGNVSDWDSTVDAFRQVNDKLGPVDVLVNNAGITRDGLFRRSEEHTSELQSLMRISYAVFCLKKKTITNNKNEL